MYAATPNLHTYTLTPTKASFPPLCDYEWQISRAVPSHIYTPHILIECLRWRHSMQVD